MRLRQLFCLFLLACLINACSAVASHKTEAYPTYDPFLPLQGDAVTTDSGTTDTSTLTRTRGPTPTRAPLSVTIPAHNPAQPLETPTPDLTHILPTPRQDASSYTVQAGDTLGSIAQNYGVNVDTLKQANSIVDENLLAVGQTLKVPPPAVGLQGSAFKIIPDSELVYGPASVQFDIEGFIQKQVGYISTYTEVVNQETLTGAQVIARIAQDYSVNPRLLLAVLEYRSQWVTNSHPPQGTLDYPLGFVEPKSRWVVSSA